MTRDISGRLYVWKYSWPSTELHCGAIKLDWNDNVVASLGNWKSTQCEVANNTAQHGKTQGWQLLAYSLKQQLISRGKKGPPSHFKACTFHTLVGSLIPPWLHHHPRPCFPVVCCLVPFTESPPLPSAAHITIWRRTNWRCVLFFNS